MADTNSYPYAHLLPTESPTADHLPPLEPFAHSDPGLRALKHPDPRSFLKDAKVIEMTPAVGTEITGLDLVTLDNDGRDQLALEVAKRGVVVVRDQEHFLKQNVEFFKGWGSHFGKLHIHPSSPHPTGAPEIHLVYKTPTSTFGNMDSVTSVFWHQDLSYELQPPGLTTLFLLAQPTTGGDTLFSSNVAALKRLSPPFVAFLKTLNALHTGIGTLRSGKKAGIMRREPIETVHPVVRLHPVTGEEALYVNSQFTKSIVGLKREESEILLKFLYDHIAKAADCHARAKWRPNTVVLWDNRVVSHTAIVDYITLKQARHAARITAQAERPIAALDSDTVAKVQD